MAARCRRSALPGGAAAPAGCGPMWCSTPGATGATSQGTLRSARAQRTRLAVLPWARALVQIWCFLAWTSSLTAAESIFIITPGVWALPCAIRESCQTQPRMQHVPSNVIQVSMISKISFLSTLQKTRSKFTCMHECLLSISPTTGTTIQGPTDAMRLDIDNCHGRRTMLSCPNCFQGL